MPIRRSDVIESIGERSLVSGVGGVVLLGLGILFYVYRGTGMLVGLAYVLLVGGVGLLGFAIFTAFRVREVAGVCVKCPYCEAANELTSEPEADFRCTSCNRLIPVVDGKVIPVQQVRCGFCNALNYYSEKNDVLICEECDREIPLATAGRPARHVPRAYARTDDDRLYELVLVSQGQKVEELIPVLQSMLAMNRNQVKQMLNELPATLLTGIPRKKAEMLAAQLAAHDAAAEFHPVE